MWIGVCSVSESVLWIGGCSVSESVEEIMHGLRCCFDKALGVILLYKCEQLQYAEATADSVPPSKIYGAEHLLRLFGMFTLWC